MRVDEFDFDLPEELIALTPPDERDGARLLHVGENGLIDRAVQDLTEILQPGDLLVFNDTKVIPAQLKGRRPPRETGGAAGDVEVDVTLHKHVTPDCDEPGAVWDAFVRPAKRVKIGDEITFSDDLSASVVARDGSEVRLAFNCEGLAFDEALGRAGVPPLPPYIARKRSLTPADTTRYQTVYAAEKGSVAAPTAGLHFTDDLLGRLSQRGVNHVMITLHVGAGTFLPVSVDDTSEHKMHAEWGEITRNQAGVINQTRKEGGRIIAVGTTSLRLLESASDETGIIHPFKDETSIFITPGYNFKIVDALMTNFHLPRSTLFMLVCALCGTQTMQAAYAHAREKGYKFYSYGDATFLERLS